MAEGALQLGHRNCEESPSILAVADCSGGGLRLPLEIAPWKYLSRSSNHTSQQIFLVLSQRKFSFYPFIIIRCPHRDLCSFHFIVAKRFTIPYHLRLWILPFICDVRRADDLVEEKINLLTPNHYCPSFSHLRSKMALAEDAATVLEDFVQNGTMSIPIWSPVVLSTS